ncbi:hypothetical protein L195_g041698 [Trifolium pratense]|uniref:Uncharacterized protein n=1 Tax=Trifolium pratense TaxID=57577 RepID=A0A2K3M4B8_TRIPR|nr:hypothetical protein L195_g041698 [Trifolium pratense]
MAQKGCAWRKIVTARLRSGTMAYAVAQMRDLYKKNRVCYVLVRIFGKETDLRLLIFDFQLVFVVILALEDGIDAIFIFFT